MKFETRKEKESFLNSLFRENETFYKLPHKGNLPWTRNLKQRTKMAAACTRHRCFLRACTVSEENVKLPRQGPLFLEMNQLFRRYPYSSGKGMLPKNYVFQEPWQSKMPHLPHQWYVFLLITLGQPTHIPSVLT